MPSTVLVSPQIIQEDEYESNQLKEITNSGLSESGVPEAHTQHSTGFPQKII